MTLQRFTSSLLPLVVLAACTPDSPTTPPFAPSADAASEAAAISLLITAEQRHAVAASVADARTRLAPALGSEGEALDAALSAAEAALGGDDASLLSAALRQTASATEAMSEAHPELAADLSALALALQAAMITLPHELRIPDSVDSGPPEL